MRCNEVKLIENLKEQANHNNALLSKNKTLEESISQLQMRRLFDIKMISERVTRSLQLELGIHVHFQDSS
jgi:hypothetical protein